MEPYLRCLKNEVYRVNLKNSGSVTDDHSHSLSRETRYLYVEILYTEAQRSVGVCYASIRHIIAIDSGIFKLVIQIAKVMNGIGSN